MHSKQKKILFICPEFNGYEKLISSSLKKSNFVEELLYKEVEIFNVHGVKKLFIVLLRILYQITGRNIFEKSKILLYRFRANGLTKRLLKIKRSGFDYIIVIKGFGLSSNDLIMLKELNPLAKFIFYQWDSFSIYQKELGLIVHFDKVFSFQREDCNQSIKYLPNPHFLKAKDIKPKEVKSLFYIGIFTLNRFFSLLKIRRKCIENNIKFDFRLYTKNHFLLFMNAPFLTEKKLDINQLHSLYVSHGAVLDLGQSNQSGVTQRFFESLSLGCSVVSFSPDASFFPGINDVVLTSEQFFNGDWFNGTYKDSSNLKALLVKYGVDNWIKELIK